jgi:8-oxo-dGTP diphosphatase
MCFFEGLIEKANKDGIIKKIAGGVIINDLQEVLLLKRKAEDFMGEIFELPSGNLEQGESIEEGLIREIKEETGLEVDRIEMYIDSFDYLSGSGKKSREFNFEVRVKNHNNIVLTEHDEYRWIKLSGVKNEEKITDEVKNTLAILKYNLNL